MPWARSEEERRQLLGALSSKVTESLRGGSKKKKEEAPSIAVDRKLALLKLRDLAASRVGNVREALWQDEQVRESLVSSLKASEPELARVLSLAVLVHLCTCAVNCELLLRDEKVRLSLLELQAEDVAVEVQEKGLLLLVTLTLPAFGDCQEDCEDLRDMLGRVLRSKRAANERLLVLRALWSAAAVVESPELFFGNKRLWAALLAGIKQEEDVDIREANLGVLSALAPQQAVAHFLWDGAVCEQLFLNTRRFQPSRVRRRALTVLAGVARDSAVRCSLWAYDQALANATEENFQSFERPEKGRSRMGSELSVESEVTMTTMKDSIMEAASRTELPSVRWPALRVLLELTWEEELMMRLIESNIAEILFDALHDERLAVKERKLCKHGRNRLLNWNEARLAEELRLEREKEEGERQSMLREEERQVLLRELPAMIKADQASADFEDWFKRHKETLAMQKEDESSRRFNEHLLFLLDMNRKSMTREDELARQVREQELAAALAGKIRAAKEQAAEAAAQAALAMAKVGGDAILQSRDAAVAAAQAAAKCGMPPRLQAEISAAEAVAVGRRAKVPLTQKEQLEEASKAALSVAEHCGMTASGKVAVAAAAAASAAAESATAEERSGIARAQALEVAKTLGMSEEQMEAAGAAAAAAANVAGATPRNSGYPDAQ
ncbi:unnamed protein product [Effrenium voratum]|uniref:Uncharacterized protein n=1 Tax=Effrenium voratum TaxID=2562239 RepID=A0AA36MP28_9DINO|nr:unnamed protein product [Effrenium voratum]